jgi:Uma2 family endonuclease
MSLLALTPEPEVAYLADDDEPESSVLRVVELPDGSIEQQQLPLTLELLLHPREGDKVTQNDFHSLFLRALGDRLERRLERQPGVAVFSDLIFQWDRLGLPDAAPDIAVVAGLEGTREEITNKVQGKFDVVAFGRRRPHLVIEVVSPQHGRLRKKDLEINVEDYARAGVEEYLIFNQVRRRLPQSLELLGYRLGGGPKYTPIVPDRQGRILSQTTGLLFWSDPERRRIEIYDAATGKRLLSSREEEARADAEAAARQAAEEQLVEKETALQAAEDEIARLRALLGSQD